MNRPIDAADLAKLLAQNRSASRKRQEEEIAKQNFQELHGLNLSLSQVRMVLRKLTPEQYKSYTTFRGEMLNPTPELGATHVTAQRLFRVHGRLNLLTSWAKNDFWLPGEIKEARCSKPFTHFPQTHEGSSPILPCSCGIWVVNSRAALKKTFPAIRQPRFAKHSWRKPPYPYYVSAQVEIWGKCIEHEWGWRAQYARIIPDTIQIYPRVNGRRVSHERYIGHLRRKYGGD
jgi:hypothetical protein